MILTALIQQGCKGQTQHSSKGRIHNSFGCQHAWQEIVPRASMQSVSKSWLAGKGPSLQCAAALSKRHQMRCRNALTSAAWCGR